MGSTRTRASGWPESTCIGIAIHRAPTGRLGVGRVAVVARSPRSNGRRQVLRALFWPPPRAAGVWPLGRGAGRPGRRSPRVRRRREVPCGGVSGRVTASRGLRACIYSPRPGGIDGSAGDGSAAGLWFGSGTLFRSGSWLAQLPAAEFTATGDGARPTRTDSMCRERAPRPVAAGGGSHVVQRNLLAAPGHVQPRGGSRNN